MTIKVQLTRSALTDSARGVLKRTLGDSYTLIEEMELSGGAIYDLLIAGWDCVIVRNNTYQYTYKYEAPPPDPMLVAQARSLAPNVSSDLNKILDQTTELDNRKVR